MKNWNWRKQNNLYTNTNLQNLYLTVYIATQYVIIWIYYTTNHLVYQDKIHILNLHVVLFLMLGKSPHSIISCSARTWWAITGPPTTSISDWRVDGGCSHRSHSVSNSSSPRFTSPCTAAWIPFKSPSTNSSCIPIVYHWWATGESLLTKTARSSTVRTVTVKWQMKGISVIVTVYKS